MKALFYNKNKYFIKTSKKFLFNKEVDKHRLNLKTKPVSSIVGTKEDFENFQNEYLGTHPVYKYTNKIKIWFTQGFEMGWFNTDRDTELGAYRWNSNGFRNTISNILFRSKL